MNATNLWITVGAPGCGKSTWLKENAKGPVVSRDEVRFSYMKDGDDYFANEKEVFAEYVNIIQKAIDDGVEHVYADATHLNERSRYKLLNALRLNTAKIHYLVFTTNIDTCLERNAKRTGRQQVPESALKRMYYSFSDPSGDDKYHGIVHYINKDGEMIDNE